MYANEGTSQAGRENNCQEHLNSVPGLQFRVLALLRGLKKVVCVTSAINNSPAKERHPESHSEGV